MSINKLKEQEVGDIIEKENIDLSSFKIKDKLNPKIFDAAKHMREDVRTRLLMISGGRMTELGSWTADFHKLCNSHPELMKDMLKVAKNKIKECEKELKESLKK